MLKLTVKQESFDLIAPFNIAHGSRTTTDVVVVKISNGEHVGYGEATPYQRYSEDCNSVIDQLKEHKAEIEYGITNDQLLKIIPPGSARNALDCAIWDMRAKKNNTTIWELAGLPKPEPISSCYTLVINDPDFMAKEAKKYKNYPILKIKLAGDNQDGDRIKAVRKNAPKTRIVIDANESWNKEIYEKLIDICVKEKVEMIEQPFKVDQDGILRELPKPITICADESCHVAEDLPSLIGKYEMVNIKLDKTGGLTEALLLLNKARNLGLRVMVGCMVGTSMAMRPAYYLSQLASLVDIDAPLLLKTDRKAALTYDNAVVSDI